MTAPYADADHYDRMVSDHLAPSIFDDGEDLQLTPATARAQHLQDVAGSDMTGANARTRGDVAGTAPAPSAPSSLANSAGVGASTFEPKGGAQ